MRLAAWNEGQAAEAKLEAKSAGGMEWESEFLFFYRCRTSLDLSVPRSFVCLMCSRTQHWPAVFRCVLRVCPSVRDASVKNRRAYFLDASSHLYKRFCIGPFDSPLHFYQNTGNWPKDSFAPENILYR